MEENIDVIDIGSDSDYIEVLDVDNVTLEENPTDVGELSVVDLYNKRDNESIKEFNENLVSNLNIKSDYDKTNFSLDWLTIMEDTIRYIDNILRNPNRFIINEEDIVKVELARRVTVESIKHLSRNTNLIQDYNKKTGDVKPSKILNINKEESYDTYENRFIYSLIQNMKMYVNFKKKALMEVTSAKDDRAFLYKGTTKIDKTKYEIEIKLKSNLDADSKDENSAEAALGRIKKLEEKITDLTQSEVYKTINKLHITLVTSPIKKTNVILKNTNFQYALKLWNYMQEHMDPDMENIKDSKDENLDNKFKELANETFLLNYLILDNYADGNNEKNTITKKEVSKKIINSMLQKILEMDSLDKKEILDLIDKYYTVVKYRAVVNDKEIHDRFKDAISNYLLKFESFNGGGES